MYTLEAYTQYGSNWFPNNGGIPTVYVNREV